jgi:hypothetical protein
MASSLRPALAGLLLAGVTLAAAPALADVFSSQGFSGDTTTLDQLPGVNLDAVPGYGNGLSNCIENDMDTSFSTRSLSPQRTTTCRFGNFSITSSAGSADGARHRYDMTYGGNPPPWAPTWRP